MNNEQQVSNNVQNAQTPGNQPPEERNRKVLRTAGIVLVVVIILALAGNSIWRHKTAPATPAVADDGCTAGTVFSATTGKPCPASSASMTADTDAAASTGPGGYEEAIHLYAGKVVIFDAECKPLPANPTFAAGTRILVANNSATPLTLSVADKSKSLAAYHYFTVPLATAGSAVVNCNGNPVTTITVQ